MRQAYRRVATGIDTLEVNAKGALQEGIPELMQVVQDEAIEERDTRKEKKLSRHQEVRIESFWTFAGQALMMAPHGVGQGQYQWLLECPKALFRVSRSNFNDIAVKVRLSSSFLWEQGYRKAWEQVAEFLTEWGEFTYQPSEAHLCVDVAGMALEQLDVRDFTRRGHVARWHMEDAMILEIPPSPQQEESEQRKNAVSVRYGEQEGIQFSPASAHSVTVYNKPREIRLKSRDKLWFGDIWRDNGWDGCEPISRVEIRYERALLHELHVETMDDLFRLLDEMWQYSTVKWIRHVRPTKDKRRERWPASQWWKTVQGATFERQDAAPAQRDKQHVYHEKRVLSAILGYIESWAAWRSAEGVSTDLDISTVVRDIAERSNDHYIERGSAFLDEVIQKRKRLGLE